MKTDLRISDTEWEIMRVVWTRHPATAAEIIDGLTEHDATWHPKTARTLLARLVRKKALGYQTDGRAYVYTPLVKEAECVAAASETFLERVFGGSARPMLAHLVETRKLTRADLAELHALLDAKTPANRKAKK
ncbi:BlaI/MecI/CopY family transcriptional regulator [Opitutaceae bacterium TAV4]|nr:BlaI/MecI/CopY family transcriptional regulator [Opitutaceae bacterium TAV4]RRK02727.1 BlaI/MecI/CopY family transcriptional regulator [Opitutaceae bacterium TAV3]